MQKFIIPLFLLVSANAQDFERIAPKAPVQESEGGEIIHEDEKPTEAQGDDVITSCLQGIVLVGNSDDVSFEGRPNVRGIQIEHLILPGNSTDLMRKLSIEALDKPLTIDSLSEIKYLITKYYHDANRPVVAILVPEQRVADGVIQLVVVEGKVGELSFSGNNWFYDRQLKRYISSEPDDSIDSSLLVDDLHFMNRNPFRVTSVILRPGQEPGTTDLQFVTRDRRPFRFFVGGDNTGIETTGRGRLFAGFNWGNAFGLDQTISYQYTASTDFGRFYAHTVDWKIPFSWKHLLSFFGGYSKIRPKNQLSLVETSGESYQASGRYTIPLRRGRSYLHEVTTGLDFKRNNTNVLFSNLVVVANSVVITQLMAQYHGEYMHTNFKLDFDAEAFYSPGDIFPHQSNSDYQELRTDARSDYVYIRGSATPVYETPYVVIAGLCRFQLSSANLLSSEQFGIGGYNTVRGYDERDLNVDNAFLASLELRTPTMHISRSNARIPDNLHFHIFLDYGVGGAHKNTPESENDYLLGFGPGMRYRVDPYLSMRFDWGIKLHRLPNKLQDTSWSKVHFSLMASY